MSIFSTNYVAPVILKNDDSILTGFRSRPEHAPRGNPCRICGLPAEEHRIRHRSREPKPVKKRRKSEKRTRVRIDVTLPFYGIDGEGQGRNPHIYTLIAAVNEEKEEIYLENHAGLETSHILNWMIDNLPDNQYIFAYAFGYDLTKILKDLPDEAIYTLFRPELRQSTKKHGGPRPVSWNGFILNLQGAKFEVTRGDKTIVIWDIFKFFQGKFVGALKDWKVGNKDLWHRMSGMKAQRGDFENVDSIEIRKYCLEECLCMSQLARKLVQAHEDAGLHLTSFYGAGSSASAMLKKMGIKEQMGMPPEEMNHAVAMAFFGGRFENSVIGEIEGPVYNNDISSAYPYQIYHLPCLIHANWKHITKRKYLEGARQALVRYSLKPFPRIEDWAPFPFRDPDGNICYPHSSGGGWVWIDEYLAGERGWPENVIFHEAWVLEQNCVCHPFKDIAHYYNERCRIGKEGPGIVMKLGSNSVYGKIAQSVGKGVFNSWVWAGMITSGCRGQLLDMITMHKDRSNCLMLATDGVFSRERLTPPAPSETGTSATGKPLGGWEEKVINQNVFIARPGIYFPMNPSKEQIKECKGRGVGKSVVFENWELISNSWRDNGVNESVKVANVTRFCGAKTSTSRCIRNGQFIYKRADGSNVKKDDPSYEAPSYGEWVTRKVEMSFNPMPKRACICADGMRLALRGQGKELSTVYSKAGHSAESKELQIAMDELLEQPDADMHEMD